LSPIYEEIHGGSRSSVSSGSGVSARSASSSSSSSAASDRGKFFYSLYDFDATDGTMLSVKRGQVLRVVHSTGGEWCYVEDRNAKKGYVPISYLKVYIIEASDLALPSHNSGQKQTPPPPPSAPPSPLQELEQVEEQEESENV
jgi:hypothetical protein